MKIYKVGGCIRDYLLGVESNDYDYVMVLDRIEGLSVEEGFGVMEAYMIQNGYKIFQSTPEMFTIRAKFPKGHINEGLTADFVLARKEVGYVEGTRRPILELGTLYDDLERRDFTINAMAEDVDNPGVIIDYFHGQQHLGDKILITPKEPFQTMLDDPLRLLRAFRFSITKDLTISGEIFEVIETSDNILFKLEYVVSQERIQNELNKMFKFDTIKSMKLLTDWDNHLNNCLLPILIKKGYYLNMTNKK
jgi:tRNA nucleotidyltransferase/poly(A) polymerase